jgi:hypothetical protein
MLEPPPGSEMIRQLLTFEKFSDQMTAVAAAAAKLTKVIAATASHRRCFRTFIDLPAA